MYMRFHLQYNNIVFTLNCTYSTVYQSIQSPQETTRLKYSHILLLLVLQPICGKCICATISPLRRDDEELCIDCGGYKNNMETIDSSSSTTSSATSSRRTIQSLTDKPINDLIFTLANRLSRSSNDSGNFETGSQ